MPSAPNPRELIDAALAHQHPQNHAAYARDIIAYAASALAFVEGNEKASEELYRLADKVVGLK